MDWETVNKQYRRYIWTVCFRILGNEADTDDAVQDTLIRAMTNLHAFDPQIGPFKAWLARIAHNVSIDILRRRGRFTEYPDEALAIVFPAPELNALQQCLDRLPGQQRVVLILKRVEGYTWEEIAELTGLKQNQARYQEEQAREAMKRCLSAE